MIVRSVYSNVSSSFAKSLNENYVEGTGIFYDVDVVFNKEGLQAQKKEIASFLVSIGIAEKDEISLGELIRDGKNNKWMTVRNADDILNLNLFIAYLNACEFIGYAKEVFKDDKPNPTFSSTVFQLRRYNPLFIQLFKSKLKELHFAVRKENILNAMNEQKPPKI